MRRGSRYAGALREFKRQLLTDTLRECDGCRTVAAERLGLQRAYVQRLIRELGIDVPSGGAGSNGKAFAARVRKRLVPDRGGPRGC